MATPTTTMDIKVQKSMFDLASFDTVTLVKTGKFTPVNSMQEAHERLGGNAEKLLAVLNRGLQSEYLNHIKNDPNIPWQTESEDGKLSVFEGTPADEKLVNNLVLSLAKSVFGYDKDADIEEKRAAKESAKAMIKNTPQIREGLAKQASKASAADTDEVETSAADTDTDEMGLVKQASKVAPEDNDE